MQQTSNEARADTAEARTDEAREVLADGTRVWIHARARLPTAFGTFEAVAFRSTRDEADHLALVRGRLDTAEAVPVRIHSECLTGDVLSSLRCDCQAQLRAAQAELGRSAAAVLLYMRQEGRGIGLANKIAAYALQDEGLDTVDANRHLGFDDDLRTYDVAAAMLRLLGAPRICLYTNNPRKITGLEDEGIDVALRRPLQVGARPENALYLATKRDRSGHLL
jgi:GTP cyclohydrolase II